MSEVAGSSGIICSCRFSLQIKRLRPKVGEAESGLLSLISETKNDEIRAFGLEALDLQAEFLNLTQLSMSQIPAWFNLPRGGKGDFGRSLWINDWIRLPVCFFYPRAGSIEGLELELSLKG